MFTSTGSAGPLAIPFILTVFVERLRAPLSPQSCAPLQAALPATGLLTLQSSEMWNVSLMTLATSSTRPFLRHHLNDFRGSPGESEISSHSDDFTRYGSTHAGCVERTSQRLRYVVGGGSFLVSTGGSFLVSVAVLCQNSSHIKPRVISCASGTAPQADTEAVGRLSVLRSMVGSSLPKRPFA